MRWLIRFLRWVVLVLVVGIGVWVARTASLGVEFRKQIEALNMRMLVVPILREAGETLRVAALLDAEEGQMRSAIARTETIFRLGDLSERSTALTCMVRQAQHHDAIDTLRRLAGRPDFDVAGARAQFEPRLRDAEDPSRLLDALRGERVFALSQIRRWIDGEGLRRLLRDHTIDDDAQPPARHGHADTVLSVVTRPFAYRDGLALNGLVDDFIAACASRDEGIDGRVAGLRARVESLSAPYFWTRMYGRLFDRLYRQEIRHVAALRVARVAMAVRELRERRGAWPAALDEAAPLLGGSVPPDPFTGAPFRYSRTDDGVRIEANVPVPSESVRKELEIAWQFQSP